MVTLPLAVIPLVMLAIPAAFSETVTPMQAMELLAKSRSVDAKCLYLSETGRQELSDYVARGEIAAAERGGLAPARAAIAAGRESGSQVLCSPEARNEVEATVRAARDAVVTAQLRSTIDAEQSVASAEPGNTDDPALTGKAESRKTLKRAAQPQALSTYGEQAMAYYVERRCGHLSNRDENSFWKAIVVQHNIALSRHGAGAVRQALRRAESSAAARSCGGQTAMLVKGSYAAIRR